MKTLWKAVRRPMIRWWIRNGSWWLLGIVLVNLAQSLLMLHFSSVGQFFPIEALNYAIRIVPILPLILLVVAATICDWLIFQSYEQQAAPMPREILWGRYLLALCQGIPVATVTIMVSILKPILLYPVYSGQFENSNIVVDAITTLLVNVATFAVNGMWLVLFVVLAAKLPVLKYGVIAALLFTGVLNVTLIMFVFQRIDFPSGYGYSQPDMQYLYLLALPFWLLFAYAIKQGMFKLAMPLQAIIIVAVVGHMTIYMLYILYSGFFLYRLTLAAEFIASPYYFHPNLGSLINPWLANWFDPEGTVVSYLSMLIGLIFAWLQPCILLGSIYLFVFSPYPSSWVGYWREKLSSSG